MTEPDGAARLRERVFAECSCSHRGEPSSSCPTLNAALDAYAAAERQRGRVEMIDRCFGQRDPDGDALLFVVRVKGIGARAVSPSSIATALTNHWNGLWVDYPVATEPEVTVADDIKDEAEQALRALTEPEVKHG